MSLRVRLASKRKPEGWSLIEAALFEFEDRGEMSIPSEEVPVRTYFLQKSSFGREHRSKERRQLKEARGNEFLTANSSLKYLSSNNSVKSTSGTKSSKGKAKRGSVLGLTQPPKRHPSMLTKTSRAMTENDMLHRHKSLKGGDGRSLTLD